MTNDIKTGVIHQHNINPECLDDEVVDLGYEKALADLICTLADGIKEHDALEEEAREILDTTYEGGLKLIGGWKKNDKGIWEPDLSKKPFAAQYDPCDGYVQIVASKFVRTDCRWCSPCFPDQGDLMGRDGDVRAYSLPPECYDDLAVPTYDLVHINFLTEGFREDWWDEEDMWKALRVQAHNLMSAVGIDARRWVPYSNVIEPIGHLGAYGMSAIFCDEDGHSLDVSCLLAVKGDFMSEECEVVKIGHKGRLILDTDDKLKNF